MYETRSLGIGEAMKLVEAIVAAAATDARRPVVVAVTDERGELIAYARMDRTPFLARRIARKKAYTAALHRADTGGLAEKLKESGRTLADYGDPDFISFAGGVALRVDGVVVGAVGVSGRTSQEDEELARSAIKSLGFAE